MMMSVDFIHLFTTRGTFPTDRYYSVLVRWLYEWKTPQNPDGNPYHFVGESNSRSRYYNTEQGNYWAG